jgi:hypothetical protein
VISEKKGYQYGPVDIVQTATGNIGEYKISFQLKQPGSCNFMGQVFIWT